MGGSKKGRAGSEDSILNTVSGDSLLDLASPGCIYRSRESAWVAVAIPNFGVQLRGQVLQSNIGIFAVRVRILPGDRKSLH